MEKCGFLTVILNFIIDPNCLVVGEFRNPLYRGLLPEDCQTAQKVCRQQSIILSVPEFFYSYWFKNNNLIRAFVEDEVVKVCSRRLFGETNLSGLYPSSSGF